MNAFRSAASVFLALLLAHSAAFAATRIDDLIARMTVEEKVGQLVQLGTSKVIALDASVTNDVDFAAPVARGEVGALLGGRGVDAYNRLQRIARASRLGIPLLVGVDAVHGWNTVAPIPLAESCAWDEDLWRRTAEMTALECRSTGYNWTFAPMIDVARDARWGRIAESAGADPFLAARFAAAKVRGFQGDLRDGRHLLACPKHFAAYGAVEGGRDYNSVELSDATLRDVYLPPFQAAFDAGALSVMSGFHTLNGEPCSTARFLLTDILRGEMGFRGFVVSDCNAIHECGPCGHGVVSDDAAAAVAAVTAGVDMDMNSDCYHANLVAAVRAGRVSAATLDIAVRRVLLAKEALGLFENPFIDVTAILRDTDPDRHYALVREAAQKSMVLLKNEDVLPIKPGVRVHLAGRLAENPDEMSGCWYGLWRNLRNASIREGFAADGVICVKTPDEADVIVGVFGESRDQNGENNSRAVLELPPDQLALAHALKSVGKPFVAVLLNGRPLAIGELVSLADAVLEAWNPGSCGGWAIADVLTGVANPSGRLTVDFPHATGECPCYYAVTPTGRPGDPSLRWSTRYIDAPSPSRMQFPFGFGLSYTRFTYANESVCREGDDLVFAVDIANVGERAGREVVQVYTRQPVARVARPVRELKGYAAVTLEPGTSQRVVVRVPVAALSYFVGRTRVPPEGRLEAWIAPSSADGRKLSVDL